jgi:hypothetical protein
MTYICVGTWAQSYLQFGTWPVYIFQSMILLYVELCFRRWSSIRIIRGTKVAHAKVHTSRYLPRYREAKSLMFILTMIQYAQALGFYFPIIGLAPLLYLWIATKTNLLKIIIAQCE